MPTNKYGFFGTPGELTLPHEVFNGANKEGGVAILVTRVIFPSEMASSDKAQSLCDHPKEAAGLETGASLIRVCACAMACAIYRGTTAAQPITKPSLTSSRPERRKGRLRSRAQSYKSDRYRQIHHPQLHTEFNQIHPNASRIPPNTRDFCQRHGLFI